MTLNKLHEIGLIKDSTTIYVRDSDSRYLTCGNWYQDNILEYLERELESFSWQNNDDFYIDLG